MSGVGDLVASLKVDKTNFSTGLNEARGEAEKFGGEVEEHIGHGASRAFVFLGDKTKEIGEKIGKVNGSLGETVSGFGQTTTAIGECVHGYHALHTVMDIAIVKQTVLNALSGPGGWVALAGGIAAAAGAYFYFSSSAGEAHESAKQMAEDMKKLKENLEHPIVEALKGTREELEKLSGTPVEQLAEHMREAGRSQENIRQVTERFKEMRKAIEDLKEARHAGDEVKEMINHLKDEIEKTKPPLVQLQDQLMKSGASTGEIAKTTAEFKRLHAELEHGLIAAQLEKAEVADALKNLTEGQKFVAKFGIDHPGASEAEKMRAMALGNRMDNDGQKDEFAIVGGAAAIQRPPEIHTELPQANERDSDAAWKSVLNAMQESKDKEQLELQKQIAKNTGKIADALGKPGGTEEAVDWGA